MIRKTKFQTILLVTVAMAAGCRGKHSRTVIENEEPEATFRVAPIVKMNDPGAASQLVKGFYAIEGNAWRWTAGKFSVQLKPPMTSAQRGATLKLALSVPDVISQKVGAVTLTASVNGTNLRSETFSKPGAYSFTADIPAAALANDSVLVDFSLDKSMPPSANDKRELGIIASSVALEVK